MYIQLYNNIYIIWQQLNPVSSYYPHDYMKTLSDKISYIATARWYLIILTTRLYDKSSYWTHGCIISHHITSMIIWQVIILATRLNDKLSYPAYGYMISYHKWPWIYDFSSYNIHGYVTSYHFLVWIYDKLS